MVFDKLPLDIQHKINTNLLNKYTQFRNKIIRKRSKIYNCFICESENALYSKNIIWHVRPRGKDLLRGHYEYDDLIYINLCNKCKYKNISTETYCHFIRGIF